MDTKLDATDIQILKALQKDGRMTTRELAAEAGLSTTPVFERQRRLEKEGYIRGYTAILDANKLERGFTVFCLVKLRQMSRDAANDFVAHIQDIPEVSECYNITGEFDYLLKINAPDMHYYNEFIINVIGTIDSVGSVQSSFVMNEIKHTYSLPL